MSDRFYEDIFKQLTIGAIITDGRGMVIAANSAYLTLSGYLIEEILGIPIDRLIEGYQLNDTQWRKDVIVTRKNGERQSQWGFLNTITETDSKKDYQVWLMTDLQICGLDPLTKMPNRFLFNQKLKEAIKAAREEEGILAVLFIDLDRFKFINDTFGHASGDQLLLEAANRIKSSIGNENMFARMGGDEFVCVLKNLNDEIDAEGYAETIINAFSTPFSIKGTTIYISCSIGISVYPFDGDEVDLLVSNADSAMYRAKKNGRNQVGKSKVDLNAGGFEKLLLENSLRKAIENDELTLYFQPQVQLDTNEIVSVEALLRWNHSDLGLISPGDFIPIAEETGLILPMGDWVLRTACERMRSWQDHGVPPVRVAVNLSASQFLHNDLVTKVKKILEDTQLNPVLLELEITENMVMHDVNSAITILKQLKELGIKISIDDFGTGYSSLNYLKEFPVDTLKIDRSFIHDIDKNQNSVALTKGITALAHDLQLNVIAEGVETSQQLAIVKQQACDAVQGYFYSKPLSNEEILQYLKMFSKEKQGQMV